MTFKPILFTPILFTILLISCEEQSDKTKTATKDKKEKVVNLTAGDTTKQLMNEEDFWNLINKSKNIPGDNYQRQISSLKTVLQSLNPIDIEKFDNTFTALLAASYDYQLWGAAYVINGGCSDDCFEYFREYLIGQGKERFYQTINDPESCVNWIKQEEEENWEGLRYAAMEAYQQKTGKELPGNFQPKFELKGKAFDEETVHKQYPKLAKKFMGDY